METEDCSAPVFGSLVVVLLVFMTEVRRLATPGHRVSIYHMYYYFTHYSESSSTMFGADPHIY